MMWEFISFILFYGCITYGLYKAIKNNGGFADV